MKKKVIAVLALGLVALLASPAVFGHSNKPGSTSATVGGGEVSVDFVGPAAKGRDVLSLIQPGSYWRMGADRATSLKTDVDLKFGDMTVPKGSYKLVAHFSDSESWSLIVAEDLGRGFKPTKVIGKAPGSVSKMDSTVENMTIKIEAEGSSAKFVIEWGTARFVAEFAAA